MSHDQRLKCSRLSRENALTCRCMRSCRPDLRQVAPEWAPTALSLLIIGAPTPGIWTPTYIAQAHPTPSTSSARI
jgi:hypothetical protein